MTFTKTKRAILLVGLLVAAAAWVPTQAWRMPDVGITNADGETVSATTIAQAEGPTVVSFWATWCKPCILELNEIQDLYEEWQDETGVKVVVISVDDARSAKRVPAMVKGKGWEFDYYLDQNSELKRALNVANVPHTFLLNKDGEVVWQHSSYVPGDEELLYEQILDLVD